MIANLVVQRDAAKFPIVSWTETRGIGAAGSGGVAAIECRIAKHVDGELMFVARGPKRSGFGPFEDGRPWRLLRGISIVAADGLHKPAGERHIWERFIGKSLAARLVWQDGAHVLRAEFNGAAPIFINETSDARAVLDQLHAALVREFIDNRRQLVAAVCIEEEFKLPINDQRVELFDGSALQPAVHRPKFLAAFDVVVGLALLASVSAAVVWVAARLLR